MLSSVGYRYSAQPGSTTLEGRKRYERKCQLALIVAELWFALAFSTASTNAIIPNQDGEKMLTGILFFFSVLMERKTIPDCERELRKAEVRVKELQPAEVVPPAQQDGHASVV